MLKDEIKKTIQKNYQSKQKIAIKRMMIKYDSKKD
jgi:high-affinity K+ transport system ATPase subunit B